MVRGRTLEERRGWGEVGLSGAMQSGLGQR